MQVLVDELYQSGSPSWGTLFWQHFWQYLTLSPSGCNSCSLSTASRLEPGRSCRHIRVRWQIAEPDMARHEETRILLHDRAQTFLVRLDSGSWSRSVVHRYGFLLALVSTILVPSRKWYLRGSASGFILSSTTKILEGRCRWSTRLQEYILRIRCRD